MSGELSGGTSLLPAGGSGGPAATTSPGAARGKRRVLFVAPVPPPVHGAALAMQYLLEGGAPPDITLLHVDSRFADGMDSFQKLSAGKLWKLVRYCWQILGHVFRGTDRAVLTPTFYFKPFLKDAIFIWWTAFILQRRTAAWFHMDYRMLGYDRLPRIARWFVRTTLRRCERWVVNSERLVSMMPEWMPRERLFVLPNGIPDLPPAAPADATDSKSVGSQSASSVPGNPSSKPLRVLYLSNIEEAKGWKVLLEAARTICAARAEVEFVIHGKPAFGLTEEEVRAEIGDGAGGRIRYEGAIYGDAKWQAFRDADIFCFPSFHESFPLSILEAMAAGLPIVATNVGGVPDAVVDSAGGWIVPPREAAPMTVRLLELIDDAGLRERMGVFNRQRYEEHYTVEAFRGRWMNFLSGWH